MAQVMANSLNNEFNMYLRMFTEYVGNLSPEGLSQFSSPFQSIFNQKFPFTDRRVGTAWVSKLKDFTQRTADMKTRNKIMISLIRQVQTGFLAHPFNMMPNFQSLAAVTIPDVDPGTALTDHLKLPQIMRQSPDQGAFLVSQPVPKCGAFCYLAVVSRPPNN